MGKYADVMNGELVIHPETIERLQADKKVKEQIDNYQREVRNELLELMRGNANMIFKNDVITVSYKEPSKQTKVDTKKMIKDGIYGLYTMEVAQKDSVQIKWNDNRAS